MSELEWVSAVINEHVSSIDDLKSGVCLCKVVNAVQPDLAKYKESRLAFVMRENIVAFLKAASSLGVPDHELFDVEDLFDDHNPKMVLTCIRALSRVAPDTNPDIVSIGPRLAQKHKPPKPVIGKYAGWGAQYGQRDGKHDYESKQ